MRDLPIKRKDDLIGVPLLIVEVVDNPPTRYETKLRLYVAKDNDGVEFAFYGSKVIDSVDIQPGETIVIGAKTNPVGHVYYHLTKRLAN